jgi:D-alanyl-D-alanine carboxypeptidase
LKYREFLKIVKTVRYSCESRSNVNKTYEWENTNKLIEKGFIGAKTGVTPSAGPCLSAAKVLNKVTYVVILIKSSSMEARWEEAPQLMDWIS